jgi:hypothetical protein
MFQRLFNRFQRRHTTEAFLRLISLADQTVTVRAPIYLRNAAVRWAVKERRFYEVVTLSDGSTAVRVGPVTVIIDNQVYAWEVVR